MNRFFWRLAGSALPLLALMPRMAAQQGGTVTATYTLPEIRLGAFIQQTMGGAAPEDHQIRLGGIGSDLWHDPADGPNVFWMITDRGPNGQIRPQPGAPARRTFPVPEFTPTILKVKVEAGEIIILQAIPIRGLSQTGAGGISNYLGASPRGDETPYGCLATDADLLSLNANGLDTEGLVRDKQGNFWVVEEYRPSILKISPEGVVLKRFVPEDDPLTGTDYALGKYLPAVLQWRKGNRGFEGAAISPDGKKLYTMLQSPASNPSASVGNASHMVRLFEFDIAMEMVTAEYVYVLQPVSEFGLVYPKDQPEMKVSGMAMLDQRRMLVLERTDDVAKLYRVDLQGATNILGTQWDEIPPAASLEAVLPAQLPANGIVPVQKELVVDLSQVPGVPGKIEGIALLDSGKHIAVANDNDFGIGGTQTNPLPSPASAKPGQFDSNCDLHPSAARSQILVIKTEQPQKQQ
jgi:hypothetical protein